MMRICVSTNTSIGVVMSMILVWLTTFLRRLHRLAGSVWMPMPLRCSTMPPTFCLRALTLRGSVGWLAARDSRPVSLMTPEGVSELVG